MLSTAKWKSFKPSIVLNLPDNRWSLRSSDSVYYSTSPFTFPSVPSQHAWTNATAVDVVEQKLNDKSTCDLWFLPKVRIDLEIMLKILQSKLFCSFDHDSIGRSRNDSLEDSSNFPDYFTECVKKEAITPPNSIKNNNNIIHNNNNDTENSPTLLQLKTEPVGNPDSPESSIDHPQPTNCADDCAGCGRLIQVKKISIVCPFTRLARHNLLRLVRYHRPFSF